MLQIFFLQDVQDLALNLAHILQVLLYKNEAFLARILSYNFSCKILARFFISCKKNFISSARLARYVQDLVQDLASLATKIFARFAYFL